MTKSSTLAVALAVTFAGAVAWACGPDFPTQMLDDRAATLAAVPQNTFAFEAKHLLPATDGLKAVEGKPGDDLPAAQGARVKALMGSTSGDEAYANGGDLPEDVRLYVAGAVAWHAAMAACPQAPESPYGGSLSKPSCTTFDDASLARAQSRFEAVLALPAADAVRRGAWAAYMLGEVHAARAVKAAGSPAFDGERDAAVKAFRQVRALVLAGASDAQGLAVASFGEEARQALYVHGKPCVWVDFVSGRDCGDALTPTDLKHAIALYAAQAGHDSDNAVRSLAAVAGAVLADPTQTAALIDGPVSQRLLVAYALARVEPQTGDGKPNPLLGTLVDAIVAAGPDKVAGADRLASLAYQLGRYDQAAQLAAKVDSPMAAWVRAKLALRKGDREAAARDYAEAAKAFPRADDPKASLEPDSIDRITGERGVLALARGEYVEALGHMRDAALAVGGDGNVYDDDLSGIGYGNDARYIAERVLTVDELKAFVDAHVPPTSPPATSKDASSPGLPGFDDRLRWLLARRLMRMGRFDDAYGYFPEGVDKRYAEVDLRATARRYAEALHDGDHAWTAIGKAEARYAAATIAREQGMALLGYEQGPDFADVDGAYQFGSGQTAQSLQGDLVTEGERQRFNASAAQPDIRLHYRYIAADKAASAADLLPPRSQAFAATLCTAASWMREGPPDHDEAEDGEVGKPLNERQRRIKAYYARYVKQGPYVLWAWDFGATCEAPDFDRARALQRAERVRAVKHFVKRWWPAELGLALLVLGSLGWAWRRRRRGG